MKSGGLSHASDRRAIRYLMDRCQGQLLAHHPDTFAWRVTEVSYAMDRQGRVLVPVPRDSKVAEIVREEGLCTLHVEGGPARSPRPYEQQNPDPGILYLQADAHGTLLEDPSWVQATLEGHGLMTEAPADWLEKAIEGKKWACVRLELVRLRLCQDPLFQ